LMLTRQVVYIVRDFEDTVAKLTFRQIGLPPRLLGSVDTEDLYREVKRSRRFQHPLSMAVIEPDVDPKTVELNAILDDLRKSIAMRFVQARLAKLLSEELRDCDLIAQHGDGFAVLLPEMTADETRRVAELLRAEAQNRLGMDLNIGVSSFPDAALTLGGLIDGAVDDLNANRRPSVEAEAVIAPATAGK
jgi:GGDEF domain-containing protein